MVPINSENNLENSQSATILVVDDTPENLRLLDVVLRSRGYKMRLAPSGSLALKSASVEPPDLILLDIIMPGLDGYEVCSRLKADPLTRNIPVIFLSAKEEVFDKIRAFDLGAVDYITKPFAAEEVAFRIERQLKIWQLSKELVKQNNLLQEELEQLRNADISNIDVLREQLSRRIDSLNKTNQDLQQQIALREKELRDRQILETELKQQNARLQEEVRERKQAEETLRERKRFIEQITETSPTLLYIFDVVEGRSVYCNRATADILGYSPQELLTRREELLAKVMYPEDLISLPEKLRQISELKDGEILESEYRLRDSRGQWRTFFVRQLVFSRTPDGDVRQVLGTAVDITDRVAAETALQNNAEFLRSIYSGLEVGIFIVDVAKDGEFRYAGLNPAHERISGIKASELRGKTPEEVLPEAAARAVRDRYQSCVEARTSITYEERLPFQSRDTWWITKLTPLFDSNDNLYCIVGTSLNITERKQAEIALRESKRMLQQISDSSPNILYLYDLVENRNVYSNRSTAELLGYSPEEIAAMGEALLPTIMHPEDFAKVPELQKRISSFNDGEVLEREYRLRDRLTGEWRTFFVREVVFSRTVDGKVKQILGTAIDITDRVNAEILQGETAEREKTLTSAIQRIRESLALDTIFTATTEELRQVLKCSRVAIYRFDADYNTGEFVAESAEEELLLLQSQREPLGLTAESELLQNSCLQILLQSPGEAERRNCNLETPCCLVVDDIEEANYSDEYRQQLEQFEIRAYLIVPIFCNFQFWGLLGAYHGGSPRQWKPGERNMALQIGNQLGVALKQAELLAETKRQAAKLEKAVIAADAANRAKSEFLANMSHELRTPLNAILGFTQVMGRDRSLSVGHQNNLTIINRAGEHLLALINDILEMSKIEAGRITFNESTFSLTAMLETLESMLKFKAQSKRLELTFDLPRNLPPGVKTDEGKLRQVLINILGNAIKFTKTGKVSLRLEIEHNSRLLFEIEDTGPGIAPEEMDSLFEAFGQTQVGRKYQQGTGLGLPISRKFVELMGGELRVRSKLGEGSVFAFDIPIAAVEGVAVTSSKRGRAIALAPGSPEYRILAVDDRADNRYLLETLLSAIGFQVLAAENGEEALALWSSWEPHLILMDMQMPVMDGFEATQRIKATDKGRKTTIIALTASAFEEDRQKILAVGCDDFASKPFQEEVLLEKIGNSLGIQYIYENDDRQSGEQSTEVSLTVAQLKEYLSQMPPAWLEELYRATVMGADDRILELLEQIPPELKPLAKALEDLTNNYQFEVILEAIEP